MKKKHSFARITLFERYEPYPHYTMAVPKEKFHDCQDKGVHVVQTLDLFLLASKPKTLRNTPKNGDLLE